MNPLLVAADLFAAVLVLVGAVVVLVTSVALMRMRDAVTRVNALSPATVFGLPLIVVGAYLHTTIGEGFTLWGFVRLLVTLTALLVVSSVASNTLARATILSGARVDPRTRPNDLADEPHPNLSA